MVRAVGRVKKSVFRGNTTIIGGNGAGHATAGSGWGGFWMEILSIWECGWEEVERARGTVCGW